MVTRTVWSRLGAQVQRMLADKLGKLFALNRLEVTTLGSLLRIAALFLFDTFIRVFHRCKRSALAQLAKMFQDFFRRPTVESDAT